MVWQGPEVLPSGGVRTLVIIPSPRPSSARLQNLASSFLEPEVYTFTFPDFTLSLHIHQTST